MKKKPNLPGFLRLWNIPTASLQRSKSPQMRVLDMTRDNLVVRFQ